MNNSEHNQRNFSDRARLGIAAGAAFIGILIAGLSEHPAIALSGTAQQEADAQSGPGIGLETADSSKTSPAEPAGPGTAAADPELQPVIWYNADGIWLYSPQEDQSVQITSYAEGGAPDRMSEFYSETTPADDVVISADGTLAAYFRKQTMSLFSGTTAELWCTALGTDQHRERKVGENVMSFRFLPDNSLVWLDADSSLYRQRGLLEEEKPPREKIAGGVSDFRVSADGKNLFYVLDIGTGYVLPAEKDTEPRRIAESVYGIEWASDDLNTIYYTNGDSDLFCISDLKNVRIVDVDIVDFVVMENTGHLYYQRADEGTAEASAEEAAAEDAAGEEEAGEEEEADLRLTEIGYKAGLATEERLERTLRKREQTAELIRQLETTRFAPGEKLNSLLKEKGQPETAGSLKAEDLLKRPEITLKDLTVLKPEWAEVSPAVTEQAEISVKYAGYLEKEAHMIRQARMMEETLLPKDICYAEIEHLRLEARQKLDKQKPVSLGAAGRIPGVNPADVAVLSVWLEKERQTREREKPEQTKEPEGGEAE